MSKIILNLDSTLLSSSGCILKLIRDGIGELSSPTDGGYKSTPNASMIYGVAIHKFREVMFLTGGHYPTAVSEARRVFETPKENDEKAAWLSDWKHCQTSCYMYWTEFVENESSFDLITLNRECYWCNGIGYKEENQGFSKIECAKCNGTGQMNGPAVEITFKIPFYEDDNVLINLSGVIDSQGKIRNGCYAIGDLKTTKFWDKEKFLSGFQLSKQLRVYRLACRLMSKLYPDSTLGRIGATNMGCFIDALFLKANANEIEFKRGDVVQYSEAEIDRFQTMLLEYCNKIANYIKLRENNQLPKEGILTGACETKYGRCGYWNCCKSNEAICNTLLKRDFKRVVYDPMTFHE